MTSPLPHQSEPDVAPVTPPPLDRCDEKGPDTSAPDDTGADEDASSSPPIPLIPPLDDDGYRPL
jgi:hypothetical protein